MASPCYLCLPSWDRGLSDSEKLSGKPDPSYNLKDRCLPAHVPQHDPLTVPHVTVTVVAAMTAPLPALIVCRRRPRGTHVRVSYTRIRSMRESCCTEEQRERQRECADYGLESVFHLGTPSSLDNLVVLVLLR